MSVVFKAPEESAPIVRDPQYPHESPLEPLPLTSLRGTDVHHRLPSATAAADPRANNFNFLRLFLATLVILGHSPELLDGDRSHELLVRVFHTLSLGDVAVDGFFIISGYLITQSWMSAPRLFDYLAKRVLRIYPAFIVAGIVCAVGVGALGSTPSFYFHYLPYGKIARDLLMLNQPTTPITFVGSYLPYVNGALWSIKYEFACYLFVAVAGMICLFRRRLIWPALYLVALTLYVAPTVTQQLFSSLHAATFNAYVVETYARTLTFFIAGVCCYLYRDRIRYTGIGAIISAIALIAGMYNPTTAGIVLSTFGAYLLFYLAFRPCRPVQRIGLRHDISYGVYLYGWPMQKLFIWYFPGNSPWVVSIVAGLAAYGCGLLSCLYVETPFMKLKSFLPSARKPNEKRPAKPEAANNHEHPMAAAVATQVGLETSA